MLFVVSHYSPFLKILKYVVCNKTKEDLTFGIKEVIIHKKTLE